MAVAGGNGERDQSNSPPVNLRPENGFPERYIVFGVGIGIFLVLLGTIILFLGKNQVASSLTICVGFGLVLAAFGAKVAGSWAGWSATGAGAMAVLLFIILQQYTPDSEAGLLKGEIGGDFSRVAEIRIIDEEPMYIYRDVQVRRIKFIGVGKALKSKRIRIQVDTIEKEPGKEFFELTGDTDKIRVAFAKDTLIQWHFDYSARQVTDGEDVILAEQDAISPTAFSAHDDILLQDWWGLKAFAQEVVKVFDLNLVNAAIEDLRNDDTFIRRNARDSLASAGPEAVPLLLTALRQSEDDYRVRLGVIYALAEMLRADPAKGPAISQELNEDDFPLLVKAAADQDKTIRYQAAEFLYVLQDPRAVIPSIDAAKGAENEGIANNQILILRQSGADLPSNEKNDIVKQLKDPSINLNNIVKQRSFSVEKILKW
ncbi:HEAT repeat domain-containing protein [Rhizobium laguerreae]|uniref:HEAT repeat domain-containing protein n=1 Tax=Rhizobium laguerreae TaxID=1076926 RepID=UPI001C900714|nr:HEAT repeat domain-containing protein [Rhizobium laguerreae]MBY3347365.1 hypothetical protein [Rhizobium laguerreae]MBY3354367.1 hypothetical protein [Rhizobium laguerreae]MBY3375372.1 hypothetical protein [Rhizobium laguerreae]MBY3385521.1 hypothetical protein [Rhizobium laguerreae]MBY3399182.1 hypothetical protein [Rhizobium laguerreae]